MASSSYYYSSVSSLLLILLASASCCYGFGTFGYNIHHRYSDPVKGILAVDDLPEKGSYAYYSALAHRDRFFRGRGLATTNDQIPLTFNYGNDTYRLNALGLYVLFFSVSLYYPLFLSFFLSFLLF